MTFKHKPTRIGLPFHGLVTSKVLPLSNGGSVTLTTQPNAENVLLDAARTPTLPPDPLPETDAANGYDFKNRLICRGVTGLTDTQMIFVDDAGVPYIVTIATTKESARSVRVTATVINEFGRFPAKYPDFNTEVMNVVIDLTDDTGTAGGWVAVNATPLYGGVEQSPDGRKCLINVRGDFSTSSTYTLKAGVWSICSVLKASLAGTFNQQEKTGVSGDVLIFKAAGDCCASVGTVNVSNYKYAVIVAKQSNIATSTNDPDPSDGDIGTEVQMTSAFNLSNEVLLFDTKEEADAASASNRGRSGVKLDKDEHETIIYCHYDNNGAEVALGSRLSYSRSEDYHVTYDSVRTPATADWSWTAINGGVGKLKSSEAVSSAVVTDVVNRGLFVDYDERWKMEVLIDGAVVDSRESVKVYRSLVHNLDATLRDDDYPVGASSASWDADTQQPPWSGSPGVETSIVFYNQGSAKKNGGATVVTLNWSEQGDDSDSAYDQSYGIEGLEYTEWGQAESSATGFGNTAHVFKDRRFIGLKNTDKGLKSNVYSTYGQVADTYGDFITYDPYTDTITDSDTPISYV